MKNLKYGLGLILSGLVFSGCSSKYEVTFDSNPRGATLICNGQNWGYTPKKLYYDEKVKEYSSLDVSSCSANWVSGYSANYSENMTIFPEGGTVTTLNRPTYGEGYPMDVQFALQVEQMKSQKRQAKAMEDANNQAELDSLNRSMQNLNNSMQNNTQMLNQRTESLKQQNNQYMNNSNSNEKNLYYIQQFTPNLYYVK